MNEMSMAYFAAHAPSMPREFSAITLGWPTDLPEYALTSASSAREPWQDEETKPEVDSMVERWRMVPPATRIKLGIEWRWHYAKMMVELQKQSLSGGTP